MDAVARSRTAFRSHHGRQPSFLVAAPGRVNLIGEHLDYNGGHVLPIALPFCTSIAASLSEPDGVEIESEGFEGCVFSLATAPDPSAGWQAYVHGVAWALADAGAAVAPWHGCVATDIPIGAGLSSSAALEVAAGLAFVTAACGEVDPLTLARAGQRVENELLGLPSGIMDQLVSAAAVPDHALLIDCASLDVEPISVPDAACVVVMDTGTRRRLVESQFAARRRDCGLAAAQLGVEHLVDGNLSDVIRLGEPQRRRARHVLTEERRTLDAARALADRDLVTVGDLMTDSHRSLRDDYEVSSPALDAIVDAAHSAPGCLGARMTGGGFAGCAVALIESDAAVTFVDHVLSRYGDRATLHAVRPAGGATRA